MPAQLNYPLRFEPIFQERIWGGRRLETMLGKKLPPDRLVGESWEISDHGDHSSVLANGSHQSKRLRDLVRDFPESFGRRAASAEEARAVPAPGFALLVKWIDACKRLSVQVHPPDGHPRLPPGERGKTECWLVIDAQPDSEIYLGLRRGFDRASLVRELERSTLERCLNVFPARPGDFYFIPAGMVHAIGDGVLVAEISQSSDTTLRLFDWDRIDPATRQSRPLQIEAALDCIDCQSSPAATVRIPSFASSLNASQPSQMTLLGPDRCPHFAVAWRHVPCPTTLGEISRFHLVMCVGGVGEITGGGQTLSVCRGDSTMLPAAAQFTCRPQPELQLLDVWVP